MLTFSWELFDGLRFQKLCNALLLMEVSKFAHVFSAPGRDNGIDQLFQGTYDSKSGKWRFQDKFHNSGTSTKDISAFKADVREDINTHLSDEDYLVFLTNLKLNETKQEEILADAAELVASKGAKACEVHLWHLDTIEGLLITYPLIYSWFWEKDSLLLEPYAEFFAKQLNASTPSLRFQQFHNGFIGRAEDLQDLKDFLSQDKFSTLALIANGGYGKTRLCVEFFKTVIDLDNEWVPLVLSPSAFNATHFKQLLDGPRRLLILIDNANEVPEIIPEAKRIIDNTGGRCKLILTTRKALLSQALGKVPAIMDDIQKKELHKLSRLEAKAFIELELPWLTGQQTAYLIELSKGIPNLVLEISQAVHDGKQPAELSADSFFADNVKKLVNEAAADIERTVTITRQQTWDAVRLLSLISPAKDNDHTRMFISEIVGIADFRTESLLTQLNASGLLSRWGGLSIKPDPYSDAVLVDIMTNNQAFINHVKNHPGAAAYFENILKNLAEANMGQGEKDFYVDSLLRDYTDQLKATDLNAAKLKSIMELAADIQFAKPELALCAIRHFLAIYSNAAHPLHTQSSSHFSHKTITEEVKETADKTLAFVVSNTDYAPDNLHTIHDLIEAYAVGTRTFGIIQSCYGYRFRDIQHAGYGNPRQCCEKQLFLRDKVCRYLNLEDKEAKLQIAIQGAHSLLGTETIRDSYYEEATGSIHITQGEVPACKHVLEIRGSVIDAMISFLRRDTKEAVKNTVLEELLQLTTYCIGDAGKVIHIPAEGVDKVLQFLDELLSNNPTIHQRTEILYRLRFYKRRDVKRKFLDRIKALEAKTENVATRYERLELFLLNKESFEREPKFEPTVKALLAEYRSVDALLNDLLKIRLLHGAISSGNYSQLLNHLASQYANDVKEFYEKIKSEQPELISEFSTVIRYADEEYFYSQIDYLRELSPTYDGTIIWLLLHGRIGTGTKQARDLNYIQPIMERGEQHSLHSLCYHLWEYAVLDKERTFSLLQLLFEQCTQYEENMFLHSLVHGEAAFMDSFSEAIKDFLFHNIQRLPIADHHGDWILSFLEHRFGFETMFEYALRKIRLELKGDEYKYLSLGDHTYTSNNSSEQTSLERYLGVIDWFLINEEEEKVADYIIRLFMPASGYSDDLSARLLAIKARLHGNTGKLKKLAQAIGSFVPTKSGIVSCLCLIAEEILVTKGNMIDVKYIFDYYHHAGGGKSKSGNGPYPQDVLKKQALEETIAIRSWPPVIVGFLNKQLKYIQADIDREIEGNNRDAERGW